MKKVATTMMKLTLDYSEVNGQCFLFGIDEIEMPKEIVDLTQF